MISFLKKLFRIEDERVQVADILIGKANKDKNEEVSFSKLTRLYDINYCLDWIHSENNYLKNNAILTIKRIFNGHRKKKINYLQKKIKFKNN